MPPLKNGDRLVIYTAADARSALKIFPAGVPAPDGFLYFSRLVFSLPPILLPLSHPPPFNLPSHSRACSVPAPRVYTPFLDFARFFYHFIPFAPFLAASSSVSRFLVSRAPRHSFPTVHPGRLSRNERVAPAGGGFSECVKHRPHYRPLIERTAHSRISPIYHGLVSSEPPSFERETVPNLKRSVQTCEELYGFLG